MSKPYQFSFSIFKILDNKVKLEKLNTEIEIIRK